MFVNFSYLLMFLYQIFSSNNYQEQNNKDNGHKKQASCQGKIPPRGKPKKINSLLIESTSNEKTKTQNPRPSPPPSTKPALQESLLNKSKFDQVNKGRTTSTTLHLRILVLYFRLAPLGLKNNKNPNFLAHVRLPRDPSFSKSRSSKSMKVNILQTNPNSAYRPCNSDLQLDLQLFGPTTTQKPQFTLHM